MKDLNSIFKDLLIVIASIWGLPSFENSLLHGLDRAIQVQNSQHVNLILNDRLPTLDIGLISGIPIDNKSAIWLSLEYIFLNQIDSHLSGNQISLRNVRIDLFPQIGLFFDLSPQKISSGKMNKSKFIFHIFALRSLSASRSSQNKQNSVFLAIHL